LIAGGDHLVSVHESGVIRVSDATTGEELFMHVTSAQDARRRMTSAVVESDGNGAVIFGAEDGTLVRLDLADGTHEELMRAEAPIHGFNAVAVLPDGRIAAPVRRSDAAYTYSRLRLVDDLKAETLWTKDINGVTSHTVFSPDGSRIATNFAAQSGPNVIIWDAETGEQKSFPALFAEREGIWFSADGGSLIGFGRDRLVVADANSGEARHELGEPGGIESSVVASDGTIIAIEQPGPDFTRRMIAFDPDTGRELWSRTDADIHWDARFTRSAEAFLVNRRDDADWVLVDTRTGAVQARFSSGDSRSSGMAIAPDGRRAAIVTGGHRDPTTDEPLPFQIDLWELQGPSQIASISDPDWIVVPPRPIFGPDDTLSIINHRNELTVAHAITGERLWHAPFARSWASSVGGQNVGFPPQSPGVTSPDPAHPVLVTYGEEGSVLHDPRTGAEKARLPFAATVSTFSADGRRMLARAVRRADDFGPEIVMVDRVTGSTLWQTDLPDGQAGQVRDLMFSADESRVLAWRFVPQGQMPTPPFLMSSAHRTATIFFR
jgi:outer membrane protein assembly factor BamB